MQSLKAAENDLRRLRQRFSSLNPDLGLVSLTIFNLIDPPQLRVLEERLQTAQKEVAEVLKVKGGHGSLRSRIYGPPKNRFAVECSIVWLLTGNSLEEKKSGELVRFTHLVYEAATGDENGQGLRDKIASARNSTRDMFASEEVARRRELMGERIPWRENEPGPNNAYWNAELTLMREYLKRTPP